MMLKDKNDYVFVSFNMDVR